MSDISPNALSLETEPTLDSPPIQPDPDPEPQAAVADDAEPEGVVEVNGRRVVDVSVLAAERKRVREATERSIREKEIAPLKQIESERDQLRAALAEVRPIIDQVRQYGIPKPPAPSRAEDLISDEDAAQEARDLELYDAKTGQPDIVRAKRIIARRRQDSLSAAQQAAQAAVGPITSQNAQAVSRQNLTELAARRGTDNQPILGNLVDPKVLAELWASLPPELTQHREVGELVLDAAIGKTARTSGRVPRPERAPVVSEPAGGQVGPRYQMDRMAKSLAHAAGLDEKSFTKAASGYTPGATNILGD